MTLVNYDYYRSNDTKVNKSYDSIRVTLNCSILEYKKHILPNISKPDENTIYNSSYLNGYNEMWMLEGFIDLAKEKEWLLTRNIIDDYFIETLIDDANLSFFISNGGDYITFSNSYKWEKFFGPLKEISGLEALRNYGLLTMYSASEQGVADISEEEEENA